MPIWARARGQTDITNVSTETEVSIPWQSYLRLCALGLISIWCTWIAGSLTWGLVAMERMSFWRWLASKWWPWMQRWSLIPIILCFAWVGSMPAWSAMYSFWLELVARTRPNYDNWKPENGLWHPFVNWRRRRLERARLDDTYYEQFGGGWRDDEGEEGD